MRTLRSRRVGGDDDSGGKAPGEDTTKDTLNDGVVCRRVTRRMKLKRISSTTEVANRRMEGGEDSENDACDGVDRLRRMRREKRRNWEDAYPVIDLSDEATEIDVVYDGVKALEVVAALDGHGSQSKLDTEGMEGHINVEETGRKTVFLANGGTSTRTRISRKGKVLRKKSFKGPVALPDATSDVSQSSESMDIDVADVEDTEQDHHGSSIKEKLRLTRLRRAVDAQEGTHVSLEAGGPSNNGRGAASRKRALDIARSRAAHFAHFDVQGEENGANAAVIPSSVEQAQHVRRAGELLAEAQAARLRNEPSDGDGEDWPGPWTVARRLVEGRSAAAAARQDAASLGATRIPLVHWSPSRTPQFHRKRVPPSLHQKCLEVLCLNIDHIESLEGVPDTDKKWLVNGLCALRKLTPGAVRVCASASPTEILIPDCTCLTEEDLRSILKSCSWERLGVLELAMCGRGITDNCLAAVCAEKGNSLPELQTLALRGAYRLVDQGLSRVLNSAPKLKSVDLTLCSLITESSIDAIADALGTKLESLVLDSCSQLHGLKLLPALRKLSNLQRLSLSGVSGVTDGVISELLVQLRFNLQELELKACAYLTDAGIQAVSLCKDLKRLDLGHLPCLTDVAIGLIADNCRNLRHLRLCRGKFTDTALAAFVNASGSCLSELSLNSTRLVGEHTMVALAQSSKSTLEMLDLSWCRLISDQALGLLADTCRKLHTLKLFGCTQVTNLFLEGHSSEVLKVTGIWESPTVTGNFKPAV